MEHFISGIHTRIDKIAELNLNDKLKGHLLLRQEDLEHQERHVVIGEASGRYDVHKVSAALHNIYRNGEVVSATHLNNYNRNGGNDEVKNGRDNVESAENSDRDCYGRERGRNLGCGRGRGRETRHINGGQGQGPRPTFYSFNTASSKSIPSAIIDTGACSSVVGKDTLERAMKSLDIKKVEDTAI